MAMNQFANLPGRLGRLLRPELSSDAPALGDGGGQDRRIARKPLWRRLMLPGLVAVFVLGGLVWLVGGHRGNTYRAPVEQLTIATVRAGSFDDYVAVRGVVAPLVTAYLTTDQGGTVKRVLVEDGDMVEKGQPLIVLSNAALQLQVAAQQLVFEQTRFKYQQDILNIDHQIGTLKNNLARDKVLLDGKAIAPSTYHQEEEDYRYYVRLRAATAASSAVEQRVRATQLTGESGGKADVAHAGVEALTVRAPMKGQLTALDAEVGQSKAAGAVLGQVNSADRFKLTASIDEYYLGRITAGQEAMLGVGGRSLRAHVSKIYPQVTNGTFRADFHFDDAVPPDTHVGQALDLRVQLGGSTRALLVPNGAFYKDTGGNWIFVVTPDGRGAVKRPVRLGRSNPEDVEIISGLKPGERVIVSGYEAYQTFDRIDFSGVAASQ
jgi:HlyD family secretion protein